MSLHGKRKEIYKYEAPWTVYAMNWSVRPDKRFRLALGSFVEEYNNKVGRARGGRQPQIPQLSCELAFLARGWFLCGPDVEGVTLVAVFHFDSRGN